jgi:hypothetical protein
VDDFRAQDPLLLLRLGRDPALVVVAVLLAVLDGALGMVRDAHVAAWQLLARGADGLGREELDVGLGPPG